MINLVQAIFKHLFGTKYYAVVLRNPLIFDDNGKNPASMSGYIFRRKDDALEYFYDMKRNSRSAQPVKIISFRSREELTVKDDNWKIRLT
jgi:hypothetical protein